MNCKKVQFLIALYIADDPQLTDDERTSFEAHLKACKRCSEICRQSRLAVSLLREHWRVSEDTRALLAVSNQPETILVRDRRTEGKVGVSERAYWEKGRRRLLLVRRVAAVAACLVFGALAVLIYSIYSRPQGTQELAHNHRAENEEPRLSIELRSENGNTLLRPGSQIATPGDERKILLINQKHRIAINANSTLLVEPFEQDGRLGCIVRLASGEIFAHVEQDGNPFIVGTSHGQAVITGTTFGIEAKGDSTTLVVGKGIVRFESQNGRVQVESGQTSTIFDARSAPTEPVFCNVAELTAWAKEHEIEVALAKIKPFSDDYDLSGLWLSASLGPVELESIDYDEWIEEKRAWFNREFPWIFQLKDALAKEGIEVGYAQLLTESGDIWQFVHPQVSLTRIPIPNGDSLLRGASRHGFDGKWLVKNVRSAIGNSAASKGRFTGLKAFEKWVADCGKTSTLSPVQLDSNTLLCLLHSCSYLANTRMLVWLSVQRGTLRCETERSKLLGWLREEVSAACKIQQAVVQLMAAAEGRPCAVDCRELIVQIKENAEAISEYEKHVHDACRSFQE